MGARSPCLASPPLRLFFMSPDRAWLGLVDSKSFQCTGRATSSVLPEAALPLCPSFAPRTGLPLFSGFLFYAGSDADWPPPRAVPAVFASRFGDLFLAPFPSSIGPPLADHPETGIETPPQKYVEEFVRLSAFPRVMGCGLFFFFFRLGSFLRSVFSAQAVNPEVTGPTVNCGPGMRHFHHDNGCVCNRQHRLSLVL